MRALARVNVAAIERNVARLRATLAPGAQLCAVVKADGYGHGAAQSGRAALAGGARMLAVATVNEAAELRGAGIDAPLLVMGAISAEELPVALEAGAEVVAWTESFVGDLARGARRAPAAPRPGSPRVHVKLDTGMGRLGTRDRAQAVLVAEQVAATPGLELAGAMTHFATADEDCEFLAAQLERFDPFAAELRARWPDLVAHAANSAATLQEPASHHDLVRCGIAIYGGDPMNLDPADHGLEPALELTSYVAAIKVANPGDSAGYGRRFVATAPTLIATLPIGYGDGVRRALSNNCDVLVGGRRYPVVGTVSMDNVTIDLGPAGVGGANAGVAVGDRATLIGADGAERQTAEDLARRIGTINHDILCGISRRVSRVHHRDGEPVDVGS